MNPQMMQMLMQMQGQGMGPGGIPGQPGAAPGAPGGADMATPGSVGLQDPQALMGAMPQAPAQPGGYLSRMMQPGGGMGGMDPRIMGLLGMMQGMGQQQPPGGGMGQLAQAMQMGQPQGGQQPPPFWQGGRR